MNKKVVIVGGVFVIIVVGGLYLLGASVPSEEGYATAPTEWSQEGDYRIEETPNGITITNEKAGFSFKVPAGWSSENQFFGEKEFTLEFLSSDAVRREGNPPLAKGCGIGLTTFAREDLWESWNSDVLIIQQYPEEAREGERVIEVGQKLALWDAINAHDPAAIEIFGEIIRVNVPISNNGVIEFGITMMPDRQSGCKAEFDAFISSFSID